MQFRLRSGVLGPTHSHDEPRSYHSERKCNVLQLIRVKLRTDSLGKCNFALFRSRAYGFPLTNLHISVPIACPKHSVLYHIFQTLTTKNVMARQSQREQNKNDMLI